MLHNRRSIRSSLATALGHQLPRVSLARVGSRFIALLSPKFLTFPSNVASRYPSPAHRPSCLMIPDFIRILCKKGLLQEQCLKQIVVQISIGWGKALPEDIICCKKIRKPVTSDVHTCDVIVLVLWCQQVRWEAVGVKAKAVL